MIRSSQITDLTVEKGLELFADEITDMVYDIAQDSAELVKPFLLAELQFYPPKPAGSKYVRTYKLKRGWRVLLVRQGRDRVDFVVENDVRYAPWVVGTLAFDVGRARSYQRDFHARHGWPLATETTQFFFEAYQEDFEKRFDAVLRRIVTAKTRARAYTRIKR